MSQAIVRALSPCPVPDALLSLMSPLKGGAMCFKVCYWLLFGFHSLSLYLSLACGARQRPQSGQGDVVGSLQYIGGGAGGGRSLAASRDRRLTFPWLVSHPTCLCSSPGVSLLSEACSSTVPVLCIVWEEDPTYGTWEDMPRGRCRGSHRLTQLCPCWPTLQLCLVPRDVGTHLDFQVLWDFS